MRADRLISILMFLQARGRMTAAELAGELERIAAAHAILDEIREKNLLGLLAGGDSTDSLAQIARVLER